MPISNDYTLNQGGKQFTISSDKIPSKATGGKISSESYTISGNGIVLGNPIINAVDIDWNGVQVRGNQIDNTGQLLNVIDNISSTGTTGLQGPAGTTGARGATGATGARGLQGQAGTTGLQGQAGTTGLQGQAGTTGLQGSAGTTGARGLQGAAGTTGARGATGAAGAIGLQGAAGTTGLQGTAGTTGARGATGAAGARGLQGAAGSGGLSGSGVANYVTYWTSPTNLSYVSQISVSNGYLYETSDERIKSNIKNLSTESYAKILKNVLTKEYDLQDGEHKIGFIAQELLNTIPSSVSYNVDTDLYSVHYNEALAAYCGALHSKILELEERLEALEK